MSEQTYRESERNKIVDKAYRTISVLRAEGRLFTAAAIKTRSAWSESPWKDYDNNPNAIREWNPLESNPRLLNVWVEGNALTGTVPASYKAPEAKCVVAAYATMEDCMTGFNMTNSYFRLPTSGSGAATCYQTRLVKQNIGSWSGLNDYRFVNAIYGPVDTENFAVATQFKKGSNGQITDMAWVAYYGPGALQRCLVSAVADLKDKVRNDIYYTKTGECRSQSNQMELTDFRKPWTHYEIVSRCL